MRGRELMIKRKDWEIYIEELPLADVNVVTCEVIKASSVYRRYKEFSIKGVLTKENLVGYFTAYSLPVYLLIRNWHIVIRPLKSYETELFWHAGKLAMVKSGFIGDLYVNISYDPNRQKLLSCVRAVRSSADGKINRHKWMRVRTMAALFSDGKEKVPYMMWSVGLFRKQENEFFVTYGNFVRGIMSWDSVISSVLPEEPLRTLRDELRKRKLIKHFEKVLCMLLASISKTLRRAVPKHHLSEDAEELAKVFCVFL